MTGADKPVQRAYVFGMDRRGEPVLAGHLALGRVGGTFTYAESWLSHPDAYPLDPVNLGLRAGAFPCEHPNGIFPVFSDAAPDAWGTRVMLLQHRSQPRNELERLLRTGGNGVGSLRFSLSRSRPKAPLPAQPIELLRKLAKAAEAVTARAHVLPEQLRLIEPGSSMGGARPKVTLRNGSAEYIAKFSKDDDLIDVPRAEYATMSLLARAGLRVPEIRLVSVGNGKVAYLIRRFDREDSRVVSHYVSAHALFNITRTRTFSDGRRDPAGYLALARILRGHATFAMADCRELFSRILANILLGNTDDHARNHGMIFDLRTRRWELAPVFDVLPTLSGAGQLQALSIGLQGRESSWDNLLGVSGAFGLSRIEAWRQAGELYDVVGNWSRDFAARGVAESDIQLLATIIEPKMEALGIALKHKPTSQ